MAGHSRPAADPLRLFAAFAGASLLAVLGFGALLLQGYRQDADKRALDLGLEQAALIAQMGVDPALSGVADLGRGLTAAQEERLRSTCELAVYQGTVLHLRVRGYSGTVVFSDDGRTDTAIPVSDPAFAGAAAGQAVVGIVPEPERSSGQVIRVLMPVVATTTGQASGVLEVTLPYEHIAQDLQDQQRRTAWTLGAGLCALYLLLVGISSITTRRLHRFAVDRDRQAFTDSLTGTPNRAAFQDVAQRAASRGEPFAVVLIDLDRFKAVNDTLGHHIGDGLLFAVAQRLVAAVRPQDLVARLGGDEFALILPGVGDPADAATLVSSIRAAVVGEVEVDGRALTVGASFGAALHPLHGTTTSRLLRCADQAMYRAKRDAGTGVAVHQEPVRPTRY